MSAVLERVWQRGDIYKADYEGYYCVDCEEYKDEADMDAGRWGGGQRAGRVLGGWGGTMGGLACGRGLRQRMSSSRCGVAAALSSNLSCAGNEQAQAVRLWVGAT